MPPILGSKITTNNDCWQPAESTSAYKTCSGRKVSPWDLTIENSKRFRLVHLNNQPKWLIEGS